MVLSDYYDHHNLQHGLHVLFSMTRDYQLNPLTPQQGAIFPIYIHTAALFVFATTQIAACWP